MSAADFVVRTVDLVQLSARIMAQLVSAKKALWLKHWMVDSSSKRAKIPFGKNGFLE